MIKSFLNTIILIIILSFGISVLAKDMTNIYIISDKNFVGDRNNLLGVANQTKEYFEQHQHKAQINEYSTEDLPKIKNIIEIAKSQAILISCSDYGISAIKTLKSDLKDKLIAVHLSHQILDTANAKHKDLVNIADIIVLPSHVLDDKIIKKLSSANTKLVQTIGVSHNLKISDVKKFYDEYKNLLPKADKYLAVILGGDAPDSKGKMHYYTVREAEKFAKYISALAKNEGYSVIVTNGPRTGKYDPSSGIEQDVHNNGKLDSVSLKFAEILSMNKIPFKLFDFQKGQKSYKELVIGAVLYNEGSKIFVPGESTSVISESVDSIPSDRIIIYFNAAMNANHKKHVQAEFKNGRASLMERKMHISHPSASSHNNTTAGIKVAEEIYSCWIGKAKL